MSKYINADELIKAIETELWDWKTVDGIKSSTVLKQTISDIKNMPSADVVEVETLKKNIEANLDEARKLRDEHSSEIIRAFQQGRMFGHECDLEMIKRGETE